uniref:Ankyrin repeat domain-containing protein n=2 Tax=Odontella aurita TaxID=265563 RepID=A0A7S4J540_9STRA|mmetsp:Transcript_38713/g.116295  ORF Transcript_38713/g.116295 Transcript_38713/m.116295 type:complete len:120 (+) Transcript_38713:131-490(+)
MAKERARATTTQLKELEDMMKQPQVQEQIKEMNSRDYWMDTEMTSKLWGVIAGNDVAGLKEVMEMDPMALHARSKDGRGPMFWAYERGNGKMIKFLKRFGVSDTFKDSFGKVPADLGKQ